MTTALDTQAQTDARVRGMALQEREIGSDWIVEELAAGTLTMRAHAVRAAAARPVPGHAPVTRRCVCADKCCRRRLHLFFFNEAFLPSRHSSRSNSRLLSRSLGLQMSRRIIVVIPHFHVYTYTLSMAGERCARQRLKQRHRQGWLASSLSSDEPGWLCETRHLIGQASLIWPRSPVQAICSAEIDDNMILF